MVEHPLFVFIDFLPKMRTSWKSLLKMDKNILSHSFFSKLLVVVVVEKAAVDGCPSTFFSFQFTN